MSSSRVLRFRVAAVLLVLAGVIAAICGAVGWMVSGCCGSPEPANDGLLVTGALAAIGLWFLAHQCQSAADRQVQLSSAEAAGMAPGQRTVYLRVIGAALVVPGGAAAVWGVGNWWGSNCCGSQDREVGFLLVGGFVAGGLWAVAWWCVNRARHSRS